MKSDYLYRWASTDQQKPKFYSLIEQEDRLTKHCHMDEIKIKGRLFCKELQSS
jgi:hypothetical protein